MQSALQRVTCMLLYVLGIAYRVWVNVASSVVDALGLPEEGVKSILREIVALSYRCVNGVSAFFVAVLVDRSYWRAHRRAWSDMDHGSGAHNWTHRIQSTLNAVVAREVSVSQGNGKTTSAQEPPLDADRRHSHKFSPAPPLPDHVLQGSGATNSQLFGMPYNLAAVSYDRGVLQETIMHLEIFVTRLFDGLRVLLRSLLLLPKTQSTRRPSSPIHGRRASFHEMKHVSSMRSCTLDEPLQKLHRSKSTGAVDEVPRKQQEQASGDLSVAALIRACGYPAEEHRVTTTDGYRLRMDRIPRHNCKRCVIFLHGVLDTSLSWVCSGVTESQAFAAWDDGCDVWLANCRSNPPRQHVDPAFQGPAYWHYTVNELGLHDLHAQIEHLHNVKCRELGAGVMTIPRTVIGVRQPHGTRQSGRRTYASEDNATDRKSSEAVSWNGGAHVQEVGISPLRGSWRSRAAPASGQHASDSDLAALEESGRAQEPLHHSAVMTSGLYKTRENAAAEHSVLHAAPTAKPIMRTSYPAHTLKGPSPMEADAAHSDGHDEHLPDLPNTSTQPAVAAPALPRVDSFQTPFEETHASQPKSRTVNNIDSTQETIPSPPSPGTPPLAEAHASVSDSPQSLVAEKSSIFAWLPKHAKGIEQEALKLGVERTGPFFHNDVNDAPLEDVVELDLAGCCLGDSASASTVLRPRVTNQSCAPSQVASATASLPAPAPGAEILGSGTRRGGSSVAPTSRQATGAGLHACSGSNIGRRVDLGSARCSDGSLQQAASTMHEPYKLTAVGHSLGGAALLIYIVQFRRTQRRHRLSRLVLLTPAGFMDRIPSVVRPIAYCLPAGLRLVTWMFPAVVSLPFYLPSSILRSLMFRLTADVSSMPALTRLVRAWAAMCTNGDRSEWDQAMRMPHYNKKSMPAVSLLQAKHMLQWFNTGRFTMFDYGSRDLNLAAYGQPAPVDIAAEYWRIDVPVDFAAGKFDGIISPQCVKKHRNHMIAAGVQHVTYREFEFGHLDFTFSAKQDLRHHVISCIE